MLYNKLKREHVILINFILSHEGGLSSSSKIDNCRSLHNNYYNRYIVVYNWQVLSKSVADAFQYYGNPETAHVRIAYYCTLSSCNVRSVSEWVVKAKPDRKPYSSLDDERLKVL